MGFLTGLFQQTVPELQVVAEPISDDANVEPGFMYRIAGSDNPILLALRPHSNSEIVGKRFAVKVYSYTPPTRATGTLTVTVPNGQLIEDDAGGLGTGVAFADAGSTVGLYREWLCDSEGVWLLVNRIDPL